MEKRQFYVDSCIWLNLFKKEGDPTKGKPFWKIAEDFIESIVFSEDAEIIYSGVVLKELRFRIDNENKFSKILSFIEGEEKFVAVKVSEQDYKFARALESKFSYDLSFYDCIHIAVCTRLKLTLVTRDNLLIKFAREFIATEKPENLFFS